MVNLGRYKSGSLHQKQPQSSLDSENHRNKKALFTDNTWCYLPSFAVQRETENKSCLGVKWKSESVSCSVVLVALCDPMDWSPARLLCPLNFPGKNTGVGSHSLLQGIFLTQRRNLGLVHCRRILSHLSHQKSLFVRKNYHALNDYSPNKMPLHPPRWTWAEMGRGSESF